LPPEGIDTILVAPKGVGPAVRAHYEAGRGVPVLVGVERDTSGEALARAAAYAIGITRGAAGMWRCTLADECDTDLFGEQAVLCGGLPVLMEMAFETLVEAGYPPEMAYFECCHEVKLIADLMDRVGVEGLVDWISDTAAFGGVSRGARLINEDTRRTMREMMGEIRSGAFAGELAEEIAEGKPATRATGAARHASLLAKVGATVRARVHGKAPSK
jgi:ketol-acid reductoisomerase